MKLSFPKELPLADIFKKGKLHGFEATVISSKFGSVVLATKFEGLEIGVNVTHHTDPSRLYPGTEVHFDSDGDVLGCPHLARAKRN